MPAKLRLANKTIWALEDIGAMCRDSRRQLTTAIDQADRFKDPGLLSALAHLSNDLADIERLAIDARNGKYAGTAKDLGST